MSSLTRSKIPFKVAIGRPKTIPVTWQTAAGVPIDITGFTIEAVLESKSSVVTLPFSLVDAAAGKFSVTIPQAVSETLPVGAVSKLRITLLDTQQNYHDFIIPIDGEAL